MTSLETYSERRAAARPSATTEKCPGHDDTNPSLTVTQGNKKPVLYCHAGCTYEAVTGALGLQPEDVYYEPPKTPNGATAPARTLAKREHDRDHKYVTPDGELLGMIAGQCRPS